MFKLTGDLAEIGLGLRPELTDTGLGASFLEAGLAYAATLGARSATLSVAAFNRRAITVYERAGFREVRPGDHATNGGVHEFVWLTLPMISGALRGLKRHAEP
jgi:[ribosomal protein S18]-alanine N-acetyltransferase